MPTPLLPSTAILTPGEQLDVALLLVRRSLWSSLPVALIATLTAQIPSLASNLEPWTPRWWLLNVFWSLLSLLPLAVLLLRQNAVAVGVELSMASALLAATRQLPAMVLLSVIAVLLIAVGLALLILPGIYLLGTIWFCYALLLLEGRSVVDSLRGSLQLTQGHWWRCAFSGTAMLTLVIIFAVVAALVILLVAIPVSSDPAKAEGLANFATLIASTLILPVITACYLVQFYDLKARVAAPRS